MADAALDSAPPKVDWRLALTGAVLLTVFFAIQQWAFGVANLALPGWFKGGLHLGQGWTITRKN